MSASPLPFPILDVHVHTELDGHHDRMSGITATLERFTIEREQAGIVGGVTDSAHPHPDVDLASLGLVRAAVIDRAEFDAGAVEDAIASGDVGAVKINLGFVHMYASDARLSPIYAAAARARVPVMFHSGDPGWHGAKLKYADPLTMDEVAVDFPKTEFVLVHAGNPWFRTAAAIAEKNPNVTLEASALIVGDASEVDADRLEAQMLAPIRWMLHYLGSPKLMFGTGWPIAHMPSYVAAFARAVPEAHRRAVFHDNAARLFRFPTSPATP